jgi:hypothetical protein
MGVGSFGGSRSFCVRSSPLTAVELISHYKKSVYVLRRQALRGMTRGDMYAGKRSSSLSLRRNGFVSELENLSRYKHALQRVVSVFGNRGTDGRRNGSKPKRTPMPRDDLFPSTLAHRRSGWRPIA